MSISLFFIISPRGDAIISKDFRGDMPAGAAEDFYRKVKGWEKGDAPPCFELDGVNYLFIRVNGLLIACSTRFNMSPSMGIELLNRTVKVIKDYCGVVSEESIRRNFILIYELLDEILDFGYAQSTSTEHLKNFIYNEAQVVETSSSSRSVVPGAKTMPVNASHKPVATLRTGLGGGGKQNGKQKNEVFVDILERLTVLFNAQGQVLNSTIDGCIQMKSYLAGNPELRLALNEDLVIGGAAASSGGGGGPVVLDDCNFHECVNVSDFETSRSLSFFPPDGEFVALNYRVTQSEFRAPFLVFPSVTVDESSSAAASGGGGGSGGSGGYKVDVTVRVRADLPPQCYGTNVQVRVPLPRTAQAAVCDLGHGSVGQQAEFLPAGIGSSSSSGGNAATSGAESGPDSQPCVMWTLKKFPGNTEQCVRVRVTLKEPAGPLTRKEVGPISLAFEVPMYNVSNLQVKYLRIADQGKAYNPYRWVRYVTQSSSYVCRV